uniref:Phosphoglycerate kinase n=1 Tax=Lygus hesperus TaxID=30085 RepID=A0A0A9XSE0_LYGHE
MAQVLASGVDLYVNDCFACAHRRQASNVELPVVLRHAAAGLSMQRELSFFSSRVAPVLHSHMHKGNPLAVVIAGGDVLRKLQLIRSLIDTVDCILVAGAVALPFMVAQGISCGRSYP